MKLKRKFWMLFLLSFMVGGCASIPPEAVVLSQRIGADLEGLHKAHRNMVQLYYAKMRGDVNSLVDAVYAPFVMRYILAQQADEYKAGRSSLYESIEELKGNSEKEEALKVVAEYMEAVNQQVNEKKDELLIPLLEEERKTLLDVDEAYENTIKANHTITDHLVSLQRIKEGQQQALSLIGLGDVEDKLSRRVSELSEYVEKALKDGRKIDMKKDDAFRQVENVMRGIQNFMNN